jgi:hypothetical protein
LVFVLLSHLFSFPAASVIVYSAVVTFSFLLFAVFSSRSHELALD